jgi:RimJ/RimL family protein N-acetyltransferase
MKLLETERLIIRRFTPRDWRDLQEYVSQTEVTKYDHEYPTSDEDCQNIAKYFSQSDEFWAVCLRDTATMIGHIVCSRKQPQELRTWHLGFVFNPKFHGKGYATESCNRVLQFIFEALEAHRVESACHPDNTPAWHLLERLSMRREAHHRKNGFIRKTPDSAPIWWDSYIYAILDEEWWAKRETSRSSSNFVQ